MCKHAKTKHVSCTHTYTHAHKHGAYQPEAKNKWAPIEKYIVFSVVADCMCAEEFAKKQKKGGSNVRYGKAHLSIAIKYVRCHLHRCNICIALLMLNVKSMHCALTEFKQIDKILLFHIFFALWHSLMSFTNNTEQKTNVIHFWTCHLIFLMVQKWTSHIADYLLKKIK